MIYMDKAILERRLHLTVTFIGGFMGCYAIFNRCDVFGSAQTGNLISFVMDLTGHSDPHMFFRFSALLIYIFAMVATVFLSHKLQKTTLKFVSLLIDALAFLLLGFFRRIWILSLHCILFFLPRHFSGVPSKVQMDSTVPASSAPTISVSARQDLQNTFTAKIPRHFEGEFFMEKYFFLFIWELQYVSCSVRDFISQVHGRTSPCMCCTCTRQEERVLSREKETEKRRGSQDSRLRASFLYYRLIMLSAPLLLYLVRCPQPLTP